VPLNRKQRAKNTAEKMKQEAKEQITWEQCRAQHIYGHLRTAQKNSWPWFARRRFLSFKPNARELVQCMKITRAIGWTTSKIEGKKEKEEQEELDHCAFVLNSYRVLYCTGDWLTDL
jgi:hypothetical protein